jgi:hypothetical protein
VLRRSVSGDHVNAMVEPERADLRVLARTPHGLVRRSSGMAASRGSARAAMRHGSAEAPTVIRRRSALTTKQIVSALSSIPKFKEKMGESFRDITVRERIEQTLRAYKAHMAKKNDEDVDIRDAMMLSTALERIAHQFAEELNDPSVTQELMPKMFEVFEADIGAKLKKKKGMGKSAVRGNVVALAKALSGGDPVTQYMHREIRKDVAAQQIIDMAGEHKDLTPMKVFDLMSERWQAALSTYTKDQQKSLVKDPVGDFNRAEAHGEYSPEFFKRMFGSETPTWEAGGQGEGDSLKLTPDAQQMLDALKAEITTPTARGAVNPRAGVTEGQERHLAELEKAETSMASTDSDFLTLFADRYSLTGAASRLLLTDMQQFLRTDMKLTITVNLEKWFGTDVAPKTPNQMFAPAVSKKNTTQLKDLFDKVTKENIEHIPTWDDTGLGASARGPSYLRFRHWKDQLMTSLQGLSTGEMASFGAGNITWDTAKGSDTAAGFGTNYYGDMHFVLDRTKFGSRIVFTAGDHGEPRRDPMLALHDLCGDGMGRTWLKKVKDLALLDNVVNAVRTKAPLVGVGLKLEFQVFGGIDMLNDVTEVWLASKHSAQALQRVQAFYVGKPVNVQVIGAAPPGTLEGGAGNLDQGLVQQLRPLVAYGGGLGAQGKQDLADARTAKVKSGPMEGLHRDLLGSCIVMSSGLERDAIAIRGHLEPGDEAVLTKAKTELNKMWAAVRPQLDEVDAGLVKRLTDQIKAANDAVDAAIADKGGPPVPQAQAPQGPGDQPPDDGNGAPSPTGPPGRVGKMRKRRLTPAKV